MAKAANVTERRVTARLSEEAIARIEEKLDPGGTGCTREELGADLAMRFGEQKKLEGELAKARSEMGNVNRLVGGAEHPAMARIRQLEGMLYRRSGSGWRRTQARAWSDAAFKYLVEKYGEPGYVKENGNIEPPNAQLVTERGHLKKVW